MLDLRDEARAVELELDTYPDDLRGPAIGTWCGRMLNEYGSAGVFEALAAQLEETGFGEELARECLGFASEERRHGVLCGAVVEALGGSARAQTRAQAPFPAHPDAPPRAAVLRNVIHVCCMSETVAVSLIGAERLEMPEGPLRELLTGIYADEIGHARFGWRLLDAVGPSLTEAERNAVEAYLPVAFAHLEHHELLHLPLRQPPPDGDQLGLCAGSDARELFYDTLSSVIRPGLARFFKPDRVGEAHQVDEAHRVV